MHSISLILAALASAAKAATYGNANIALYHSSQSCTGSVTKSTVVSPAVNTQKEVYSQCYISSADIMSLKLTNVPTKMKQECIIVWYADEKCQTSNHGSSYCTNNACQNTTIASIFGTFQAHSYQLDC